jgi:hypothetical protein
VSSANEFSRVFTVDPLPALGLPFELEASAGERAALVRRFDLDALDRLHAVGRIAPAQPAGTIEVNGRLQATLAQRCVVTLEPVAAELDVPFRRMFAPIAAIATEVEVDPVEDEIEPLADARLDVGELVAEELAVALDPYPHGPDVTPVGDEAEGEGGDPGETSPFRALERLRTD